MVGVPASGRRRRSVGGGRRSHRGPARAGPRRGGSEGPAPSSSARARPARRSAARGGADSSRPRRRAAGTGTRPPTAVRRRQAWATSGSGAAAESTSRSVSVSVTWTRRADQLPRAAIRSGRAASVRPAGRDGGEVLGGDRRAAHLLPGGAEQAHQAQRRQVHLHPGLVAAELGDRDGVAHPAEERPEGPVADPQRFPEPEDQRARTGRRLPPTHGRPAGLVVGREPAHHTPQRGRNGGEQEHRSIVPLACAAVEEDASAVERTRLGARPGARGVRAERLHRDRRDGGARRGPRGRPPARGGGGVAAARDADRGQGRRRRRRATSPAWGAGRSPGPRPPTGRSSPRPAPRRPGADRAHDAPRARRLRRHRFGPPRDHPQPAGARADARRVVGRVGGGRGRGDRADRDGERRRRLHPHPGRVLRAARIQADPGDDALERRVARAVDAGLPHPGSRARGGLPRRDRRLPRVAASRPRRRRRAGCGSG